jgi:hypothetical protein
MENEIMRTYQRLGVVFGALIGGLVLAGAAQATVIVPAGDGSYSYSTTLTVVDPTHYPNVDPWGSANGNPVDQQDKFWTYVSSSGPNTNTSTGNPGGFVFGMAPVYFSIDSPGGVDHHSLELGGNTNHFKLNVAGTYTLEYTIQVAPGSNALITGATLAVNGILGSVSNSLVEIKKILTNSAGSTVATLDSLGGSAIDVTFAGVPYLHVLETITVKTGGQVTSTSDTYVQTIIPEPPALLIWSAISLGGAGMAVVRRRKAARAPWSDENRTAIHEIIARGVPR